MPEREDRRLRLFTSGESTTADRFKIHAMKKGGEPASASLQLRQTKGREASGTAGPPALLSILHPLPPVCFFNDLHALCNKFICEHAFAAVERICQCFDGSEWPPALSALPLERMSRATTTPVTDACISPLVTPAPSPMA